MSLTIKSSNIIKFLKKKKLYSDDNTIVKTATLFSSFKNSKKNSVSWCKNDTQELSAFLGSILIVPETFEKTSQTITLIKSKNPRIAFAKLLTHFNKQDNIFKSIHKTATLSKDVILGENTVIGEYSKLTGTITIGNNVTIQNNVSIFGNVTIGNNVEIQSGVVIGNDGFGFYQDPDKENWQAMCHVGGVSIGNNVVIKANTCIDRGVLDDTTIGDGTKIDNLCHIAHNVIIGKNCLIIAGSIICGSTTIGNNTWVAPGSNILNKLKIGENALIGLGSVVTKNVGNNHTVAGNPAKPINSKKGVKH
tara:strand:+ start:102 stop:1019 length:918 start_codon:yes stop_codon:yes gene_type:complete